MKAALEKIAPVFGSSFAIRKFTNPETCKTPHWHFHPEYEIVYISNGTGKRHIGNHISHYEDGDLIFLGPNLPHFGFCDQFMEEHVEIVIQMRADFLGKDFFNAPEMSQVKLLFERSKQGLIFDPSIKQLVGKELIAMPDMDGFDRLLSLLKVLKKLAQTEEYTLLNAKGLTLEVQSQDHSRINTIYQHVEHNFKQEISLDEMASKVNMTVPAFCRYFKKLTGKTFTHFVNEFRIGHACQLLAEGDLPISEICFRSGFNNFSHFNKQFKLITGSSPSKHRKELKTFVS
ncbi:MAG: AraC family transcriptional regulator [Bacteroidota bacterium]